MSSVLIQSRYQIRVPELSHSIGHSFFLSLSQCGWKRKRGRKDNVLFKRQLQNFLPFFALSLPSNLLLLPFLFHHISLSLLPFILPFSPAPMSFSSFHLILSLFYHISFSFFVFPLFLSPLIPSSIHPLYPASVSFFSLSPHRLLLSLFPLTCLPVSLLSF